MRDKLNRKLIDVILLSVHASSFEGMSFHPISRTLPVRGPGRSLRIYGPLLNLDYGYVTPQLRIVVVLLAHVTHEEL